MYDAADSPVMILVSKSAGGGLMLFSIDNVLINVALINYRINVS